jgi:hypothetical protein
MSGRPPKIRILGVEPVLGEVTIDMQPAAMAVDGQWTAPGWTSPGHHAVRYSGILRRYEIVDTEESWEWWAAHANSGVAVAGALSSSGSGRPAIVLQEPGAWLLGARPGEAVRAAPWPPSFVPVWAVPLKGRRPAPCALDSREPPKGSAIGTPPGAVWQWRQIVRDAARAPVSGGTSVEDLWQRYRATARSLKRRGR